MDSLRRLLVRTILASLQANLAHTFLCKPSLPFCFQFRSQRPQAFCQRLIVWRDSRSSNKIYMFYDWLFRVTTYCFAPEILAHIHPLSWSLSRPPTADKKPEDSGIDIALFQIMRAPLLNSGLKCPRYLALLIVFSQTISLNLRAP